VQEGSKKFRDVKVILGEGKKRMHNALRMIETIDSKGTRFGSLQSL